MLSGLVILQQDSYLYAVVGQQPTAIKGSLAYYMPGGSGGTFLYTSPLATGLDGSATLLMVAGGGGGVDHVHQPTSNCVNNTATNTVTLGPTSNDAPGLGGTGPDDGGKRWHCGLLMTISYRAHGNQHHKCQVVTSTAHCDVQGLGATSEGAPAEVMYTAAPVVVG